MCQSLAMETDQIHPIKTLQHLGMGPLAQSRCRSHRLRVWPTTQGRAQNLRLTPAVGPVS
jgi:hypothetical protein